MTLSEKMQLLQSFLEDLHVESAKAFTIQGLYREPEDFIIKDIPDLIRLIKTEDFQFRFDFKSLDSVGRIKSASLGRSIGGINISIPAFDIEVCYTDLSVGPQPIFKPESGVWGMPDNNLPTNSQMTNQSFIEIDFSNIGSLPDTLIPASIEGNN